MPFARQYFRIVIRKSILFPLMPFSLFRYGRRPVILVCSIVYGVFGILSAFVTNYYGFLALRIIVGMVHHTFTHLPFILGMRWFVTERNHAFISVVNSKLVTCEISRE